MWEFEEFHSNSDYKTIRQSPFLYATAENWAESSWLTISCRLPVQGYLEIFMWFQ